MRNFNRDIYDKILVYASRFTHYALQINHF